MHKVYERIYVDMDGVLVDMMRYVFDILGYEKLVDALYKHWPQGEGDQYFYGSQAWGISQNEINRVLGQQSSWEHMPKLPWADDLIKSLEEKVGATNVYLLSSPGQWPGAWTGKFNWVYTNLPSYKHRLILTRDKSFVRGPALLIDDRPSTVFEINKSEPKTGYGALLFPAPWNIRHRVSDPVQYVTNFLNGMEAAHVHGNCGGDQDSSSS